MNEEQKQLESRIDRTLGEAKAMLSDSPKSLKHQIDHNIGFYFGFCYARGWEVNLEACMRWEKMSFAS